MSAFPRPDAGDAAAAAPAGHDSLAEEITALQLQLAADPGNSANWATLALDYVEQAKVTVDPSYYPKAEGALDKSLDLDSTGNFIADAGEAALAAARHDFAGALDWADKGIAVDSYNAALYGAQADALTQLGRYQEAAVATQHMLDLRPGTPSFSRASYVAELRGDIPTAVADMQRAAEAAPTPADTAFADYYLGDLAYNAGDPATALRHFTDGLQADPAYEALIEGKAKAEAALGDQQAAVRDYATVVSAVPQPQYVIEYGTYLDAVGRHADAQTQYALLDKEFELFQNNGVQLDTDPTLFYADHGNPAKALDYAQKGITIRPFVEMDDAYAWALHVNHRDAEALGWSRKALATGTRNALFHYHAGMIEASLGQTAPATADLSLALQINPHFDPLQAPIGRQTLQQLKGSS